jgi:transcriptional regulator
MYIPPAFQESDPSTLHDLIERHNFGLLVSHHDGAPFATHLPFLLDRTSGPAGTLLGHMARANPQWRHGAGQPVLTVFSGPHAYISPTWYEAPHTVPTWNYVAVHAYGRLELVEDHAGLLAILRRSVDVHEQSMPRPWTLDESPAFIDRLLPQIVGFRIVIDRLEGKLKLNQNHPLERRAKVARALAERKDENSSAIADLMRRQPGGGAKP